MIRRRSNSRPALNKRKNSSGAASLSEFPTRKSQQGKQLKENAKQLQKIQLDAPESDEKSLFPVDFSPSSLSPVLPASAAFSLSHLRLNEKLEYYHSQLSRPIWNSPVRLTEIPIAQEEKSPVALVEEIPAMSAATVEENPQETKENEIYDNRLFSTPPLSPQHPPSLHPHPLLSDYFHHWRSSVLRHRREAEEIIISLDFWRFHRLRSIFTEWQCLTQQNRYSLLSSTFKRWHYESLYKIFSSFSPSREEKREFSRKKEIFHLWWNLMNQKRKSREIRFSIHQYEKNRLLSSFWESWRFVFFSSLKERFHISPWKIKKIQQKQRGIIHHWLQYTQREKQLKQEIIQKIHHSFLRPFFAHWRISMGQRRKNRAMEEFSIQWSNYHRLNDYFHLWHYFYHSHRLVEENHQKALDYFHRKKRLAALEKWKIWQKTRENQRIQWKIACSYGNTRAIWKIFQQWIHSTGLEEKIQSFQGKSQRAQKSRAIRQWKTFQQLKNREFYYDSLLKSFAKRRRFLCLSQDFHFWYGEMRFSQDFHGREEFSHYFYQRKFIMKMMNYCFQQWKALYREKILHSLEKQWKLRVLGNSIGKWRVFLVSSRNSQAFQGKIRQFQENSHKRWQNHWLSRWKALFQRNSLEKQRISLLKSSFSHWKQNSPGLWEFQMAAIWKQRKSMKILWKTWKIKLEEKRKKRIEKKIKENAVVPVVEKLKVAEAAVPVKKAGKLAVPSKKTSVKRIPPKDPQKKKPAPATEIVPTSQVTLVVPSPSVLPEPSRPPPPPTAFAPFRSPFADLRGIAEPPAQPPSRFPQFQFSRPQPENPITALLKPLNFPAAFKETPTTAKPPVPIDFAASTSAPPFSSILSKAPSFATLFRPSDSRLLPL